MGSVSEITMADTSTIDTMVDTASTVNLEPLMLDVPGYGYVLLILVLTWFLLFWQGNMVGRARTKYKVELPTMYSDTETTCNCLPSSSAGCWAVQPKNGGNFWFYLGHCKSYLLHWLLLGRTQEQNCRFCARAISWRDASRSDGLPTSWSVCQMVGYPAVLLKFRRKMIFTTSNILSITKLPRYSVFSKSKFFTQISHAQSLVLPVFLIVCQVQ